MVARDHDRLDTRADSVGNSRLALLTRRVDHRDKTKEGVVVFGFDRKSLVAFLVGKGQNAQTLLGVFIILIENYFLILVGNRTYAVLCGDADAAVEDRVERALCEDMRHAVEPVFGAHHLAVGVKRNLLYPAEGVADNVLVKAYAARGLNQRVLCRVADALAVDDAGVVVENHVVNQTAVALEPDVELFLADTLAVDVNALNGHLVLGERARLIGADNRHAAETFNRL